MSLVNRRHIFADCGVGRELAINAASYFYIANGNPLQTVTAGKTLSRPQEPSGLLRRLYS